jgi:hypothetical protein
MQPQPSWPFKGLCGSPVFSSQHDPRAADSHSFALACQFKINGISFSILIRNSYLRFAADGSRKQSRPEFLCVGCPQSNGCKHASFVAAPGMVGVQAVVTELLNVDNGTVPIWQLHGPSNCSADLAHGPMARPGATFSSAGTCQSTSSPCHPACPQADWGRFSPG